MNAEVYAKHKTYFYNNKQYMHAYHLAYNSAYYFFLTGPLYTISILKQLSVPAHKNIYSHTFSSKTGREVLISEINTPKSLKEKIILYITKADSTDKQDSSKTSSKTIEEHNKRLSISGNTSSSHKIDTQLDKVNSSLRKVNNDVIVEKPLSKPEGPLTMREQRNYDIIKASGVPEGQQPYRAPIYDTYKQMLTSLNKQGILSFWKGILYRTSFYGISLVSSIYFYGIIKEQLSFRSPGLKKFSDQKVTRNNHLYKVFLSGLDGLIFTFCLSSFESLFNCIFMIENRFVMQNRLPQFRIYSSSHKLLSRGDYFHINNTSHFIKNFFFFGVYNIFNYISKTFTSYRYTDYDLYFAFLATYPFNTAIRRVVCQCSSTPGLLPKRYMNVMHAIFLIRKEEGIFNGWFKGFLPYSFAKYIFVFYFLPFTLNIYQTFYKKNIDIFS